MNIRKIDQKSKNNQVYIIFSSLGYLKFPYYSNELGVGRYVIFIDMDSKLHWVSVIAHIPLCSQHQIEVRTWDHLSRSQSERVKSKQILIDKGQTFVLLPNHQKYVRVPSWLGHTTALMLTSLFLMATKGTRRWTCSTGPEGTRKAMSVFLFPNKQKLTFPDSLSLPSPIIKQQLQTHRCWGVCVCVCLKWSTANNRELNLGFRLSDIWT